MVISLALSIIEVVLVLIIRGLSLDIYAPEILLYIINFTYIILQIVLYIWCFWVSLTLMARQIEKGRLCDFWHWNFDIFNSCSLYWHIGRHGYACYI